MNNILLDHFLEDYDSFIGYIGKIRNRAKEFPEYKEDILRFIGNENFKKSFDQGKCESLLRINFPKQVVDIILNKKSTEED